MGTTLRITTDARQVTIAASDADLSARAFLKSSRARALTARAQDVGTVRRVRPRDIEDRSLGPRALHPANVVRTCEKVAQFEQHGSLACDELGGVGVRPVRLRRCCDMHTDQRQQFVGAGSLSSH